MKALVDRATRLVLALIVAAGCASFLWSQESQEHRRRLEEARMTYRQAVRQHGPQSQEASAARQSLRQSRRIYHDALRNERAQPRIDSKNSPRR